jgi:ankyrin repeat protein
MGQTGSTTSDKSFVEACRAANLPAVKELVSKYGVNAVGEEGITALIWASYSGHLDIVQYLVSNKANLELSDPRRNTALSWSCYHGHMDIVSYLIEKKADIEHRDDAGSTPLLSAAYQGHSKVVQALLKVNAIYDARDKWGGTPLLRAASRGHAECARGLIEAGADINRKTTDDLCVTPLIACSRGIANAVNESVHGPYLDTIQLLVEHGADTEEKDKEKRTVLNACQLQGYSSDYSHVNKCVAFAVQKGLVVRCEKRREMLLEVLSGNSLLILPLARTCLEYDLSPSELRFAWNAK